MVTDGVYGVLYSECVCGNFCKLNNFFVTNNFSSSIFCIIIYPVISYYCMCVDHHTIKTRRYFTRIIFIPCIIVHY